MQWMRWEKSSQLKLELLHTSTATPIVWLYEMAENATKACLPVLIFPLWWLSQLRNSPTYILTPLCNVWDILWRGAELIFLLQTTTSENTNSSWVARRLNWISPASPLWPAHLKETCKKSILSNIENVKRVQNCPDINFNLVYSHGHDLEVSGSVSNCPVFWNSKMTLSHQWPRPRVGIGLARQQKSSNLISTNSTQKNIFYVCAKVGFDYQCWKGRWWLW